MEEQRIITPDQVQPGQTVVMVRPEGLFSRIVKWLKAKIKGLIASRSKPVEKETPETRLEIWQHLNAIKEALIGHHIEDAREIYKHGQIAGLDMKIEGLNYRIMPQPPTPDSWYQHLEQIRRNVATVEAGQGDIRRLMAGYRDFADWGRSIFRFGLPQMIVFVSIVAVLLHWLATNR